MFDSVLLIGFGGPEKSEDVTGFLDRVLAGAKIPRARCEQVLGNYRAVGGKSPYNALTRDLAQRLAGAIHGAGVRVPVFFGMRNWHPFLGDTISRMAAAGFRKSIGVVLAPHRSPASHERYLSEIERAAAEIPDFEIDYVPAWHLHPLFIGAQVEVVRKALGGPGCAGGIKTAIIFTAHSIPAGPAGGNTYARDLGLTAREVMKAFPGVRWEVAYQSRSGSPAEPWLGPDVCETVRGLGREGFLNLVVVPVGFIFDHVEILYDLDIAAKGEAERAGMRFVRVPAAGTHPLFLAMLKDLILRKVGARVS